MSEPPTVRPPNREKFDLLLKHMVDAFANYLLTYHNGWGGDEVWRKKLKGYEKIRERVLMEMLNGNEGFPSQSLNTEDSPHEQDSENITGNPAGVLRGVEVCSDQASGEAPANPASGD